MVLNLLGPPAFTAPGLVADDILTFGSRRLEPAEAKLVDLLEFAAVGASTVKETVAEFVDLDFEVGCDLLGHGAPPEEVLRGLRGIQTSEDYRSCDTYT